MAARYKQMLLWKQRSEENEPMGVTST